MYGIRSKSLAQFAGFVIAVLAVVAPQSMRAESLGDALVGAYRNSALLGIARFCGLLTKAWRSKSVSCAPF